MAARHTFIALTIVGCTCVSGAAAAAQDSTTSLTTNTFTAPADSLSPRATLQEMAWFAGQWRGPGLGGETEEHWSTPAAGAMMGMFRLIKDGKVVFYEFLTLVEQDGSLMLKLKHFNPDLTGWEEKADSVMFPLVKVTANEICFRGLTFRRAGPDKMEIFLAIRNKSNGSIREEAFSLTRVN